MRFLTSYISVLTLLLFFGASPTLVAGQSTSSGVVQRGTGIERVRAGVEIDGSARPGVERTAVSGGCLQLQRAAVHVHDTRIHEGRERAQHARTGAAGLREGPAVVERADRAAHERDQASVIEDVELTRIVQRRAVLEVDAIDAAVAVIDRP